MIQVFITKNHIGAGNLKYMQIRKTEQIQNKVSSVNIFFRRNIGLKT